MSHKTRHRYFHEIQTTYTVTEIRFADSVSEEGARRQIALGRGTVVKTATSEPQAQIELFAIQQNVMSERRRIQQLVREAEDEEVRQFERALGIAD